MTRKEAVIALLLCAHGCTPFELRDLDAGQQADAADAGSGPIDAGSDAADASVDGGCASGASCPTGCVDLDTDARNCGACGIACALVPSGTATCGSGVCDFACDDGFHACDDHCASDLDPASCGASCAPCPVVANATATCDGTSCGHMCDVGYYDCGGLCVSSGWMPIAPDVAGRTGGFVSAWTGSELLVWGGQSSSSSGSIYDPLADAWTAMALTGAPPPRRFAVGAWTGSELLVFPGDVDGQRFDPVANAWTSMVASPLTARVNFAGAWTGAELVVFGGINGPCASITAYGDGARYDPISGTWRSVSPTGAPSPRGVALAAWTGTEVIVWGGQPTGTCNSVLQTDGALYNPATDTWRPMTSVGAPSSRADYVSVWTGRELIVWGGLSRPGDTSRTRLGDGARYDPALDSWTPMATGPVPRDVATAVWTGSEMIVWGGRASDTVGLADGAAYNPTTDAWRALPSAGAPSARYYHRAVWTGCSMIVFGGDVAESATGGLASGAEYVP
jgi:N-acetylneuraminic acid mutarotase